MQALLDYRLFYAINLEKPKGMLMHRYSTDESLSVLSPLKSLT